MAVTLPGRANRANVVPNSRGVRVESLTAMGVGRAPGAQHPQRVRPRVHERGDRNPRRGSSTPHGTERPESRMAGSARSGGRVGAACVAGAAAWSHPAAEERYRSRSVKRERFYQRWRALAKGPFQIFFRFLAQARPGSLPRVDIWIALDWPRGVAGRAARGADRMSSAPLAPVASPPLSTGASIWWKTDHLAARDRAGDLV
jgi:hypothetical protein